MNTLADFLNRIALESAILVEVHATRGSVPRDSGTWMAVFADALLGTIGGGRLELDAIAHARARLAQGAQAASAAAGERLLFRLGPSLGQCCGGEVQLQFDWVGPADAQALRERLAPQRTPLALFGGGHVGRALVQVLCTLPLQIRWIDSRDEIFPAPLPAHVQCEHSNPVHAAVASLQPDSRVLIMSFSHAEDLDVLRACLVRQRERGDLPYIGLIGSKTKWASFAARLRARGFSDAELRHVTCPIGISGIADKRPQAIAISVAAQLLLLQNAP